MPSPPETRPTAPLTATAQMASMDTELARLSRDHRRFLEARHPLTASIWLALMRPADEVLQVQSDVVVARSAPAGVPPSDEPGERQVTTGAQRPAILVLGEALVAQALMGSAPALTQIAERIEGKVGTRRGEEDPVNAQRRAEMQGLMETLVRAVTNEAAARPGDDAAVVDVVAETPG